MNASSGRRWVGAIATFTAMAACGRSGASLGGSGSDLSGVKVLPTISPSASVSSVLPGTVTGVARMYGGPLVNGKMADDGTPGSGITLTATRNGQLLASTVTDADGSYSFTLVPGSYVIAGCANAAVLVRAGQIDHQDIGCPIP